MAMPRILKNWNIFNDAQSYLGVAKEATIPKLVRKMEGYRGGGMNGSVKADMGMGDDGMVFEYTLGGLDLVSIKQFAATSAGAIQLRFAGAYQQDDTGQVSAGEIVVRGRYEEIDFGNAKPGDLGEQKIKMPCSYYKLIVDGAEIIEIDILNFIERVDGKDMLAAQRKAIGL